MQSVAKRTGTPFYAFDTDIVRASISRVARSFGGARGGFRLAYAVKANSNPAILEIFRRSGTYFDVVSPGEVAVLLSVGASPRRIIYTSVGETAEEFGAVIRRGVRRFVLGSASGLTHLKQAVRDTNRKVEVMLRLNPDVEVSAHISTSGLASKFGLPISSSQPAELMASVSKDSMLSFIGVHFHLGTQIRSPKFHVSAINKVLSLVKRLDVGLRVLDIGGGFPVSYERQFPKIEDFGKAIVASVNSWMDVLGEFELIAEPGRYLMAEAGALVAQVVNIKNPVDNRIAIVDASYNELPDILIGQEYPIRIISSNLKRKSYRIAGNLCDGNDWFVRSGRLFPEVSEGDLVVFRNAGAYSNTFHLSFCNYELPPILLGTRRGLKVVRQRTRVKR